MIITIKNLQQQTFTVEFDPAKTVLELKDVIFKNRGDEYNIEKQKLIYAGVILEDDRTLLSYNVEEKKFVVVMLKRDVGNVAENKLIKVENTENKVEATKVESLEKVPEVQNAAKEETPESSGVGTGSEEIESNIVLQSQAESNLLMGEEYNRSVDYLIEMGYTREMVERAMAASYNNPDRAVEYLISGIPNVDDAGFGAGTEPDARNILNTQRTEMSNEGNNSNDPFEFLRDQPQFLQMRSLVYQNPDLLHAVLQQIGQTNPALLQLISENQDAFLNMLNQPLGSEEQNTTTTTTQRQSSLSEQRSQLAALSALAAARNTGNSMPENQTTHSDSVNRGRSLNTPSNTRTTAQTAAENFGATGEGEGPAVIRLTRAEQDAIERLKAMGFPEALVLQAYFACDKDEQLAANFLVSSAFED